MKCEYCNNETHGGYCDCMIVDGEFKGKWWRNDPNWIKRQTNKNVKITKEIKNE